MIEKIVAKLYGQPCWGVKPGYGSFLTLEFGDPNLEIREPIVTATSKSERVSQLLRRRAVFVHGAWHLWIQCCDWTVKSGNKRIGDSSTKVGIKRAAAFLDGQKLTHFSISPKRICTFNFDLGATLRTKPYDNCSEQWYLFEPAGRVLIIRADGFYSYSSAKSDKSNWKALSI